MSRARETAKLISNNTFRIDSNNAVGFGSTTPDAMFDINAGLTVAGIITASGGISGAVTGSTTQITVADESSDTTCFPVFVTAATGNLPPKSGSNLTFNSSNGTLTATTFSGSGASLTTLNASNISSGTISDDRLPATITSDITGDLTGNADTATTSTNVTVADESSDTTCFPLFVTAATGDLAPKSGSNLTFNSSTGTLETTNVTVTGDLTVQGTTTTLDTDLIGVDKVEVGANNSTVGLAVTQSGSGAIIAAYDGASEVFRVDDGGNIGVGLNNPSVPLHIFGSYPTLKVQNSATAQYASASIDLQGPAGDERYTKLLHGNSNTGGTETYFQIEQYDSAGSYVKTLAQYNYQYDYWSFLTGGTERLKVDYSGITVTGDADISGIATAPTFYAESGTYSAGTDTVTNATIVIEEEGSIYTKDGAFLRNLIEKKSDLINIGQQNTSLIDGIHLKPGTTGGSVKLHAGGSADNVKLETTASGITVTGDVTISDKIIHSGDTNTAIRFPAADTFTVETGGSERVRVTSDGDFGIGTNNPSRALHISSSSPVIRVQNSGGTNQYTEFFQAGSGSFIDNRNNTGAGPIAFRQYDGSLMQEAMRINSDGNIGVGTNSPSQKLEVDGNVLADNYRLPDTGGTISGSRTTTGAAIQLFDTAQRINFNTAGSERVRITSVGNVGIATDSPDAKFHAFGNSKLEGDVEITPLNSGGEGGHITLRNPDKSSTGAEIDVSSANTFRIFQLNNNSTMELGQLSGTGGTIVLKTQATERMKIYATGEVTKPTNPCLKTLSGDTYASTANLFTSPAVSVLQASADINIGNTGWTTSGTNAYSFVCPVTGVYAVHAHISLGNITENARTIWSMAYTLGGGNFPLATYVEVIDVVLDDYMNYSYQEDWYFTAGTRVAMGKNATGYQAGYGFHWGIRLVQ